MYIVEDGLVHVVDITHPASPLEIDTWPVEINAQLALGGDVLYARFDGRLNVYDVSVPSSPRWISTVSIPTYGAGGWTMMVGPTSLLGGFWGLVSMGLHCAP